MQTKTHENSSIWWHVSAFDEDGQFFSGGSPDWQTAKKRFDNFAQMYGVAVTLEREVTDRIYGIPYGSDHAVCTTVKTAGSIVFHSRDERFEF